MKSVISKQLTLVLFLVFYCTTCSKLKINKNLKKSSFHHDVKYRVKVTGKSINIYENNEDCFNDCAGLKSPHNICVTINSNKEISKALESIHAQFTQSKFLCFLKGNYHSNKSLSSPNIFDEEFRADVEPLSFWGVYFKNQSICDSLCGGLYNRECSLVDETEDQFVCAFHPDYLDETD